MLESSDISSLLLNVSFNYDGKDTIFLLYLHLINVDGVRHERHFPFWFPAKFSMMCDWRLSLKRKLNMLKTHFDTPWNSLPIHRRWENLYWRKMFRAISTLTTLIIVFLSEISINVTKSWCVDNCLFEWWANTWYVVMVYRCIFVFNLHFVDETRVWDEQLVCLSIPEVFVLKSSFLPQRMNAKTQWIRDANMTRLLLNQVLEYQPVLSIVEMFGYMGGYIGIWLGFSLLSVLLGVNKFFWNLQEQRRLKIKV